MSSLTTMSARDTGNMAPDAMRDKKIDTPLDVAAVRRDFPILHSESDKPLVYLDSAATTQKPRAVIDTISDYYLNTNANVHRGVYDLSMRATKQYDAARAGVASFLGAAKADEIVFTRSATEAINLIAQTYGRKFLGAGDEILITGMEHHSNIVPWQLLCEQTGAVLRVVPIDDRGQLVMDEYERLLNDRTRLVSVLQLSNALGTQNPVESIVELAHRHDARVLIDGAQAVSHMAVDMQALDCDFYVFSGHKVFGPTGIGALYGKADLLASMPPYQGGGDMIRSVTFEKTTYADPPARFEAGTPNIAGVIGLGAALEYIQNLGLERIAAHEKALLTYATDALEQVPGLRIIGTAENKASVISFVMDGVHPHDVGTIVDTEGVAIRTGHHCAQPVMERFNLPATARASIAVYNTTDDIDRLVRAIEKVNEVFR